MLRGPISDIMSEEIVTVKESASLKEAAHLLLRFQINGIFVVSEESGELIGILTTTDLLRILDDALSMPIQKMTGLQSVANLRVSEVATRDIVKVQKDATIARVITLMHKKQVHTVPVYDNDRLVGVVGRHDFINAAFE